MNSNATVRPLRCHRCFTALLLAMKNLVFSLILIASLLTLAYWLTPEEPLPAKVPVTGYIDMHVHVGCMGVSDNDCFLSPSIEWDRDVVLRKYLGVPESVFGRS